LSNTATGKEEYDILALRTLIDYFFSKLNSVGSSDLCHRLIKTKEINVIAIRLTAFDPARLAVKVLCQHYCSLV